MLAQQLHWEVAHLKIMSYTVLIEAGRLLLLLLQIMEDWVYLLTVGGACKSGVVYKSFSPQHFQHIPGLLYRMSRACSSAKLCIRYMQLKRGGGVGGGVCNKLSITETAHKCMTQRLTALYLLSSQWSTRRPTFCRRICRKRQTEASQPLDSLLFPCSWDSSSRSLAHKWPLLAQQHKYEVILHVTCRWKPVWQPDHSNASHQALDTSSAQYPL